MKTVLAIAVLISSLSWASCAKDTVKVLPNGAVYICTPEPSLSDRLSTVNYSLDRDVDSFRQNFIENAPRSPFGTTFGLVNYPWVFETSDAWLTTAILTLAGQGK